MAITPTSNHPVSDAAPPQLGTSQPLPSGNDDGTLRINPGVYEQITRATVDVLLELTHRPATAVRSVKHPLGQVSR